MWPQMCLLLPLMIVSWLNGSLLWSARIGLINPERDQCDSVVTWQSRSLSTGLQPVWQFKQSLLIVDDVKVVDVCSHLWAAFLCDSISWKNTGNVHYRFKWRLLHFFTVYIHYFKWLMYTDPCDLSDTVEWAVPCLLSCAKKKTAFITYFF